MEVKKTRKRLKSLADIRRFLALIINQTYSGELEPSLSGRLAYMLNVLKSVVVDSDLEARIVKLERAIEKEAGR